METCIKREPKDLKMIITNICHYGIRLETKIKKENEIRYLKDKKEDFTTFKSTKKVHEASNYKSADQLRQNG